MPVVANARAPLTTPGRRLILRGLARAWLSVSAALGWFATAGLLFGGMMFVLLLATGHRRPRKVEKLPASVRVLSVPEILARSWRSSAITAAVFAVAGHGPGGSLAALALIAVSPSHRRNLCIAIDSRQWRPSRRTLYEPDRPHKGAA